MAVTKDRFPDWVDERLLSFPPTLTYPFSRSLDYSKQYLIDLFQKVTESLPSQVHKSQNPAFTRLIYPGRVVRAATGLLLLSTLVSTVSVLAQEDPNTSSITANQLAPSPDLIALAPTAIGPDDALLANTPDAVDQAQDEGAVNTISNPAIEVALANPDSSNLNTGDSVPIPETPKPFSPRDFDHALTYGPTFGSPDLAVYFVNHIPPNKKQIQVSVVLPDDKVKLYQSLITGLDIHSDLHLLPPDSPVFQNESVPLRIMDGGIQYTSNGQTIIPYDDGVKGESVGLFHAIFYREWPYKDSNNPIHITRGRYIGFYAPVIDTFQDPDRLRSLIQKSPAFYHRILNELFLSSVRYNDPLIKLRASYPDGRIIDF